MHLKTNRPSGKSQTNRFNVIEQQCNADQEVDVAKIVIALTPIIVVVTVAGILMMKT